MKGVIQLTEGRSGSNWLGSLTDSTGVLGLSKEWVDLSRINFNPKKLTGEQYIASIIDHASTPNGFFAIKMFPRHLHWFQMQYGYDLIKSLNLSHDILFIKLTRRDRVGQAISFTKALQTGAWRAHRGTTKTPEYDFEQICRSYFMIGRSYDYWNSYVNAMQLKNRCFVYEDLLENPVEYVDVIAAHADITDYENKVKTDVVIQRNSQTEEWRNRFEEDVKSREFVSYTTPSKRPPRHISNIIRFFRKKQMKPVPYGT
jgi:LPS sulfotransferase NodH